jgi:hypothetical protein
MIIDNRSYFGSTAKEITHLQEKLLPILKKDKDIADVLYSAMHLAFHEENVPVYLFTKPVQQLLPKIKVSGKTLPLLANTFKDGEVGMILLGKQFIRYIFMSNCLFSIYCYLQKNDDGHEYIHYSCFMLYMGLHEKELTLNLTHTPEVLQALIFLKAGEQEIKIIESGKKVGTRRDGFLNLTTNTIKVVNSGWNTIIINTEGFSVDGHIRLQACGEKHKDRKLIWINPFEKEGYVRKGGGVKE